MIRQHNRQQLGMLSLCLCAVKLAIDSEKLRHGCVTDAVKEVESPTKCSCRDPHRPQRMSDVVLAVPYVWLGKKSGQG